MTSRDFCYWLQGKIEIDGEPLALSKKQVSVIQKHLALVFKHEIDPSYGDEKHQTELQEIHDGPEVDCVPIEKPEDAALTPQKIKEILEQASKDLEKQVKKDLQTFQSWDPKALIRC